MERYKALYKQMSKSGALLDIYENLSGDWEEDKEIFIEQQKAMEYLAHNSDIYGED